MKKKILLGLLIAFTAIIGLVSFQVSADTTVYVSNLQPDYGAIGGGGVYSAYYGPPAHIAVSPGTTAVFDSREAGIIKAGFNTTPADDEGLFAFIPNITIDAFAAGTLTYDVENQTGVNPVWMTIEIDTGTVGVRSDNTAYQFVPTSNPAGWNTFDAGAGLWQQWTTYLSGITTGSPMTLSTVAAANTDLNVVRTYLRLGMGESYYNGGTGTTAWVDKTTIGGVTYDFVLYVAPTVPTITTPINGATVTQSAFDKVDWTDSTGGTFPPFEYQYAAFSDAGYTSNVYTSGWLTISEIPTPGTPPGDYYVRVKARDANGTETAWSNEAGDVHKITVVADPTPTPTPINPFPVPAQCDQSIAYNLIEGTNGSNVINGTNGSDLILAKGGSDKVDGKNGNDCIVAGAGADSVKGGNGNDAILGGDGADDLRGENDSDKLYGEGGADSLRGGNGADTLVGGGASDAARGEGGTDTCDAESENSCEI